MSDSDGTSSSAQCAKVYWPAVVVIILFPTLLVVWSCLDHNIPVWDSAGHLLKAYSSAEIIQRHIDFGPKVAELIRVSIFYTPLTYYFHALLICLFGHGAWVDVIPRIFWYALSCVSLYLLAQKSFDDPLAATYSVALWCIYPGMYGLARASGLLDIPMAGMVFLTLWMALVWSDNKSWKNASLLGLIMGMTFLTKQTAALFLIAPMAVLLLKEARYKRWTSCLMLIFSGLVGGALFAGWFIPNYKAFHDFVSQNQSVLVDQPFITMFFTNLVVYGLYQSIACTAVASIFFIVAVLLAKKKSQAWMITTSVVSGFVFHSALNWIPQPRYVLATDGLMAMISALLLAQMWRSSYAFLRVTVVLLCIYSGYCYLALSFCPPLPVIRQLEDMAGLTQVRLIGSQIQNVTPMWPIEAQDWGHDWLIDTVDRDVKSKPVWVHIFSDTRELNTGGLDYVSKLRDKSNIRFITFRGWNMAGYDFKYTKDQLNDCRWFVVLENSKAPDGRTFISPQAESNYKKLIVLVTKDSSYETVGIKKLPNGSHIRLVRRRDWNKPPGPYAIPASKSKLSSP